MEEKIDQQNGKGKGGCDRRGRWWCEHNNIRESIFIEQLIFGYINFAIRIHTFMTLTLRRKAKIHTLN